MLGDTATGDGYRHFGGADAAIEPMEAVRGRWEEDGTLPDDNDDLRASGWRRTLVPEGDEDARRRPAEVLGFRGRRSRGR